jgi:hypothetical protein
MWLREWLSATNFSIKKENVVPRTVLCDKFFEKKGKCGSENCSLRQIQREKRKMWSRDRLSVTNKLGNNDYCQQTELESTEKVLNNYKIA